MKGVRLVGCLWRLSLGQPPAASGRRISSLTAESSVQPSGSASVLPVTLEELQRTTKASPDVAIAALDSQLNIGDESAAVRSAALGDLLCRYVAQASQPATGLPSAGQMVTVRLLQQYNGAMPGLKGQLILAKVLNVDDGRILVDTGFHGLTEVPRTDVTISHIVTADGSAPSERYSSSDIRPGDTLRLRLEAYYTPYGDMQLTAVQDDMNQRRRVVWTELQRRMHANEPVSGRILNESPGGFSVGVAGFVARLPAALTATDTGKRIGVKQDFLIVSMDAARKVITLRDPVLQRGGRR